MPTFLTHARFGALIAVAGSLAAGSGSKAHGQEVSTDELLQQLREREMRIDALERRLNQLEAAVGTHVTVTHGMTVRSAGGVLGEPAAGAEPQPPSAQAEGEAQAARSASPGLVEVDELAAERALERSLTVGGALLLQPGQVEVQPSLTYTRRENDVGALFSVGGAVVGGTQRVERNEIRSALDARLGLPWSSQLEIGLSHSVVDQSLVSDTPLGALSESDDTGTGIGDLRVGLAKAFVEEEGWRPSLVGRVTYDSGLGDRSDNGVALDGGFHSIRGSLTALKRQDPLAFVGTLFYETSFEESGLEPGDQYGLRLETLLAASPDTSLRFGLQQTFIDDFERNGTKIPGSDQTQSTAIFGVSSVLGRGVFLDVQAGIGLTEDAPDYFIGVSLPIRFDSPLF